MATTRKPPLEGKDKFDGLMRLVEFRLARHAKRKEYEWKLSLGLWAVLAAGIITIKLRPSEWILAAILITIVFLHAFYWVIPVSLRNRRDMQMAFYYANRAALLVGQDIDSLEIEPVPVRVPRYTLSHRWSALLNEAWDTRLPIVITILLSACAFLLIGRVEPRPSPSPSSTTIETPAKK